MKKNLRDYLKKVKAHLKAAIERNQGKSSWINFSALLTNIIMLMAYISISPALAEYQGTGILRFWACVVIIILAVIAAWEFICQLGCQRLNSIMTCLWKGKRKITGAFRTASLKKKVGSAFAILVILSFLFIFYHSFHWTEYYSSVVEVYGIPTGVGESLPRDVRKNRAGYFKIEDYPFKHQIVLSYVEAYRQLDLMREYSTVYNMAFFQPSARVVYTYTINKNRYLASDQNSYVSARENGFRESTDISYYSSTGKVILKLEKNDYDKFEVVTYSAEDMPQLLNSTLFRMSDNQVSEKEITAQVEITYNSKGLPKTRRLNPNIYNQYGVNGERYDYDEKNRLTALYYLDINGDPVCNKSGIMMVAFQYEDNGQLRSIRYFSDEEGVNQTEGYQGVFCEKFSYDDNGNLAERKQYNRNGNGEYDKNAVCTYRYSYENGALIEEAFFGVHNETVRDNHFYSSMVSFKADNEEEEKKKLTISFDSVKASEKTNSPVKEAESNLQGRQPVQGVMNADEIERKAAEGTGREKEDVVRKYEAIRYVMDNEGHVLVMEYRDEKGNPVINEEGYAIKRYQYDDQKRKTGESYFDSDDMPCMNNSGYASVRYTYGSGRDEKIKSKEFLDIYEKLILNTETGYALVKYERFEQGRGEGITEFYYDQDEKPVRLPEYGYAGKEQIYNESGLLIREVYFDEWGNLTYRTDHNVAEIQYEYADDGNIIREWYKDANGQPANRSDTGYAAIYQEFDAGLLVEKHYEEYRNQTWEAVPDRTTGAASVRYSYHNGRKQEEQYFDTEGNLTLRSDIGCAVQRFEYNDTGMLSAQYFYGTDQSLLSALKINVPV